jgi:beta-xylosidase
MTNSLVILVACEPARVKTPHMIWTDEGQIGDNAAVLTEAEDPIADALWKRVDEEWENEALHAAFLDHMIRSKQLPDAAGRYRSVQLEESARSALAKKKLDAIVIAAMQMMSEGKTPAEHKKSPYGALIVFAISMVLLVWLTLKLAQ